MIAENRARWNSTETSSSARTVASPSPYVLLRPTARAAAPVRAAGDAISLVADIVLPLRTIVRKRYRTGGDADVNGMRTVGAAGIEPATSRCGGGGLPPGLAA